MDSKMNYYDELRQNSPPSTGAMAGDKQDGYDERLKEARRLTELMRVASPVLLPAHGRR